MPKVIIGNKSIQASKDIILEQTHNVIRCTVSLRALQSILDKAKSIDNKTGVITFRVSLFDPDNAELIS